MTATADPITFAGDRMSVAFRTFGPKEYALFLRVKALPESETAFDPADESYTVTAPARFAALLGAAPPARAGTARLAAYLFPDQKLLTRQALDAKRFALWCQCGYGKTPMGLEYARQVARLTGGRVLVVTLNEIVGEWREMADRFYGKKLRLHRVKTRAELREWCQSGEPGVGITNYEKFNPDPESGPVVNECRHLAGVVLDEASRLRAGGGKQKWSLIKSCKGVEYKLTLTATPAPNDLMEFASQAAFLEKMRTESDIIWTFFTRDPRTQKWTVKPHARAAFFRWMASWSVYVADPRRYGWRLDLPPVPDPVYQVVEVPPTAEQLDLARRLTADAATGQQSLFGGGPVGVVGRGKLSQAAKGFQYRPEFRRVDSLKPAKVAEIVRQEHARGAQILVWTLFDAETAILADLLAGLPGVDVLSGKVPAKNRPAVIDRFRSGESRVLVSKAKLLGYGLNFQCCDAMVFSGFSDSFEDLYQCVRRAVRFGQTAAVRVYFPVVRELEGEVFDNLDRKQRQFLAAVAEMEAAYVEARKGLGS